MAVSDLSSIIVAGKYQSGLGVPASGATAFGIEVLPSSGMAMQVATIESQMIQRSKMAKRPRQGSRFVGNSYETELQTDNLSEVFEGTLGGTWAVAQNLSNATLGAVVISGTGTLATFGTAAVISSNIVAGMFARFTNLSVAANNSLWVPILSVTSTTMVFPSGILIDNASDAAYNVEIARALYTATPYVNRYITWEEYLGTVVDRSKLGTDLMFGSLNFSAAPDSMVRVGFGLGGKALDMLASGLSPNFTSPVFQDAPSLTLLDGGIYLNGVKRTKCTGFTWGLTAPVSGIPVIGSVDTPDVFVGQFRFAGQFTVVVEDATDFDLFDAETRVSAVLHCAEQGGSAADFVGFYLGNLSFGGFASPVGGEGGVVATINLYGGEDERGTGYAATTVLISTSEA